MARGLRNIRRAMVNIMSSALDAQRQWALEDDATPLGFSTEPLMGRSANNSAIVSAGRAKEPGDAVTCMLWCAIALGGLTRGRPVEQACAIGRPPRLLPLLGEFVLINPGKAHPSCTTPSCIISCTIFLKIG